MKKLLTAGILGLLVSSCGLKSECGKDVKMACNLFMGYDPVSQVMIDATDRNLKKLINDVGLQGKINDLVADRLAALELKSGLLSGFIDNILNNELTDEEREALNSIISVINQHGDDLSGLQFNGLSEAEMDELELVLAGIVDSLNLVNGEVGPAGPKGETGDTGADGQDGTLGSSFEVDGQCVEIYENNGGKYKFREC